MPISTLRRWEGSGRPVADRVGTHRQCDLAELRPEHFQVPRSVGRRAVACARVSSHDHVADLKRQVRVLGLRCARQGRTWEAVADLGSCMDLQKRGLDGLLDGIAPGEVGRSVVTDEDRLLRFGAELVSAICAARQAEVVIVNRGEDTAFEDDLAEDVPEVIAVHSARLYGGRSRTDHKLPDDLRRAAETAGAC